MGKKNPGWGRPSPGGRGIRERERERDYTKTQNRSSEKPREVQKSKKRNQTTEKIEDAWRRISRKNIFFGTARFFLRTMQPFKPSSGGEHWN